MRPINFTHLFVLTTLVTGCAGTVENNLARDRKNVESSLAEFQKAKEQQSVVIVREEAKVAGQERMLVDTEKLPEPFYRKFAYMSVPQPLSAILGEIGRRSGYKIIIQGEARSAKFEPVPLGAVSGQPSSSTPATPMFNVMPYVDENLSVDWHGDMKGLLDYLAGMTGMYWEFEDGAIHFFKVKTRTFYVRLPAGDRTVSSLMSLTG
ncbi:MAG: hypothetical protein P3W87_007600, partial [Gammaproteobacteria bacterium]|nr:hypothetical protein [Gammaproteobacteria bacterium]